MKEYSSDDNSILSDREVIGFNDIWLRIIGIPLIGFIIPTLFFHTNPLTDTQNYFRFFVVSLVYAFLYWFIDRKILIYFRRKLPQYNQYNNRLLYQSIVVLVVTVSLCSVINLLLNLIVPAVNTHYFQPSYLYSVLVSIIITIVIISIYESKYAFNLFKESLVKNEALQKENSIAQLQSLKNQVNPHFLFNSLNTLMSLIPENPETAVEFVANLSKVYRYILEIKEKDYIALNDELTCNDAYMFLLKIRFGKNINFHLSGFTENKNQYTLPLSIQMLIENAVKHNIISTTKPLTITITANENSVVVSNNLQLKSTNEKSTKTGLINIEKRYELLSSRKIEVNKTNDSFEVKIPLLKIDQLT